MGRPRGSRNRNTLARELMAAVNDQDEAYVEHENAKVLDVANGCNDSSESESELDESQDSDFDPAIELCSQTSSQASALPCVDPKAKAPTQPLPTSSRKATTGAKPKALTQTKSTKKIARVKKPLDAVELTQRNFELFRRGLESRQNNQFELLNENFRTFATSMQQTTKGIYKMIYGLNKNLVSFLNFQKNNSDLAIKRHTSDNPVTKIDFIDLSDSPVLDSKLSHLGQAGKSSVRPFFDSSNIASSQITQIKTEPIPPVIKQERQPERPIVDYQRLMAVTSKHTDITRIATAAFTEFWKVEIDTGMFSKGDYNVYGIAPKGSAARKFSLDPQRVIMLQNFVMDKMPSGVDKEATWKKCVSAIHKKLHNLKGSGSTENMYASGGASFSSIGSSSGGSCLNDDGDDCPIFYQ
jgi:hypothetical protein